MKLKKNFHQNIECIQYNAALVLSGDIRRTSMGNFNKHNAWSQFNVAVGKGNFVSFIMF